MSFGKGPELRDHHEVENTEPQEKRDAEYAAECIRNTKNKNKTKLETKNNVKPLIRRITIHFAREVAVSGTIRGRVPLGWRPHRT